ncbi:hypothetical protein B0H15DRAFT_805302 [Mycena belliarum]|uniref:Uncharacterized protein n=1 Tax=Mycena belliarum TaxID=1033014 RepID=A0AAD6TVQ4_9AGAR|nr:hypothetical protein B0H15DRAFT_805302 [Mycena belliae]
MESKSYCLGWSKSRRPLSSRSSAAQRQLGLFERPMTGSCDCLIGRGAAGLAAASASTSPHRSGAYPAAQAARVEQAVRTSSSPLALSQSAYVTRTNSAAPLESQTPAVALHMERARIAPAATHDSRSVPAEPKERPAPAVYCPTDQDAGAPCPLTLRGGVCVCCVFTARRKRTKSPARHPDVPAPHILKSSGIEAVPAAGRKCTVAFPWHRRKLRASAVPLTRCWARRAAFPRKQAMRKDNNCGGGYSSATYSTSAGPNTSNYISAAAGPSQFQSPGPHELSQELLAAFALFSFANSSILPPPAYAGHHAEHIFTRAGPAPVQGLSLTEVFPLLTQRASPAWPERLPRLSLPGLKPFLGASFGTSCSASARALPRMMCWHLFWCSSVFKLCGTQLVKARINFAKAHTRAEADGVRPTSIGKGVGMAIGLWGIIASRVSVNIRCFFFHSMTTGVLARTALYARAVGLSPCAHASAGLSNSAVLNHVSTDMSRVDAFAQWFHAA